MKKLMLLILLFILIIPLKSIAQFTLRIEINGLRSSDGNILLQVFDEEQNTIKDIVKGIENDICTIVIENLKSGKYAFRYFHDENGNEEMETNWMGIPKEGFGISNNAIGLFGPKSFKKWLFELSDNKKVVCTPKYM